MTKRFLFFFRFCGWSHVSLGLHICFSMPNIEVHLPFCFIRIGWMFELADGPQYSFVEFSS